MKKKDYKYQVYPRPGDAGSESFHVSFKWDYVWFGTTDHCSGTLSDRRSIRKLRNGLNRILKDKPASRKPKDPA